MSGHGSGFVGFQCGSSLQVRACAGPFARWFVSVLILLSVSSSPGHTAEPALVCSSFAAWALVEPVAGPDASLWAVGAGRSSPHGLSLSAREVERLRHADTVFVLGLGLETWLSRFRTSIDGGSRPVILDLSQGLERELIPIDGKSGSSHDPAHGDGFNPHYWLDPILVSRLSQRVADHLAARNPAGAAGYQARAAAFRSALAGLDAGWQEGSLRWTQRRVVTRHDAFPYLLRRYGLTLAGVVEPVPDLGASPRHLSELSALIRREGIGVLFAEAGLPPKLSTRLAGDLGVSVAELDTLEVGELNPGAYLVLMRRNLEVFNRFLAGKGGGR